MFPRGTVTFLFTDIEGSTPLWEQNPQATKAAIAQHNAILRQSIEANGGVVFKIIGDAFQAAFELATQGLSAALAAQRGLLDAEWGETGPLRVRMGLHTGPAEWVGDEGDASIDYAISHTLNRAARVMAAGHGGQILLSQEAADLVRRDLPPGVSLKDLGDHRLKGLIQRERLFQVLAIDLPQDFPALTTEAGSSTAPPLLSTKLSTPRIRPELVPRARLTTMLNAGIQCRLILVSAPAGFGKTTLLSTWLAECQCPVAWVSLDTGDNDPVRFLSYVIAALQSISPEIGEGAQMLLYSPQAPPLESVLAVLINELCSHEKQTDASSRPCLLVLDDYHVIDAPAVHGAVAFLLENLPSQLRLVIATRADPPLLLSRWRSRGQLLEIRVAELRFALEEAATFLNTMMGLGLSTDDIAAMLTRTEGWIAALQLAALSMRGREKDSLAHFVNSFTGSHHYIVDYLVEEVLDRQPQAMLSFLLHTSILESLSGPLCDALLDRTDGQAMLEAMEQANMFLLPLDDDRQWYRYHHLFADALQNRLLQTYPETIAELHRRAAAWYERNGYAAQALNHALAAADRDRAVRIVEQNGRAMFMRGEIATLANWLESLGEVAREHPWLGIYRAWTLTLTAQMAGVEKLLEEIEDHIHDCGPDDPAEAQNMLGEICIIRGLITYFGGDALRAAQFCQQALESISEDNLGLRCIAAHVLAETREYTGDLTGAYQANAEAARLAKMSGLTMAAVAAMSSLADILIEQGKLFQAAEIHEEALTLVTRSNGMQLPAAGRVYACLSKVLYHWNDLEGVTRYAQHAIELCQLGGIAEYLTIGYIMLARSRLAQGDLDGAQEAINEAEHLAQNRNLPSTTTSWLEIFRVRLWLAQGHLEKAVHWAGQRELQRDDHLAYTALPEYLALVRVLLAKQEYDSALTLSERLLRAAEAGGRTARVMELLVLQALAHQAQDDMPRAMAVLDRVLSLAQPEGFTRIFLDEGKPMAALLRQAQLQPGAPHEAFVTRLLSELAEPSEPRRDPTQSLIEPLSERELEVLRLVAIGLSNREIADELVLATGTVKKHLSNIFGKLEAHNRTECVARARELQLLE
jgi:LuxR family maltose regulon positive regulatory protein